MPERCIYWPRLKALLIADTHFGKITHFRKSGIAVPDRAARMNLQRLEALFLHWKPEQVLFLGDLFHSEMNTEWLAFKELLRKFPAIGYKLVQGNHDILHDISYANVQFQVYKEPLPLGPFLLSHEPEEGGELYNLCGHIHPGVRLTGEARQTLRLPCFYFGAAGGILPAFGEFTGLYLLKPRKHDKVYVVTGDAVLQVQ